MALLRQIRERQSHLGRMTEDEQRRMKIVERKLGRERALGQAFKEDKLIEIDPRQPSKEYLDTVLHEGLHIVFPKMTEREVAAVSRKLSKLVWRQGYRRIYR